MFLLARYIALAKNQCFCWQGILFWLKSMSLLARYIVLAKINVFAAGSQ
jgi:hypothetical protein